MKNLFLSLIILFLSTEAKSNFDEKLSRLAIKGGLGLSYVDISRDVLEEKFFTPVINTQVSWYLGKFEFTANALMSFGKVDEIEHILADQTFTGEGKVFDVAISPLIKYELPIALKSGQWPMYLGAGPAWSLYTLRFRDNQAIDAGFDVKSDRYKLTYDTFGYNIVLGVEELTAYKDMHPVYIEFVYSYRKSKKISLVDTEQFIETNIVKEQKAHQEIKYHSLMIIMGMTFF